MKLKDELNIELLNILDYWMTHTPDESNGGFHGELDIRNVVNPNANKGAILNARILWTFSAAYNTLKNNTHLKYANRSYEYIMQHFIDTEYGGVYWELDKFGNPINDRKQIYAIAFTIYGLSEYYKATQKNEALKTAITLYDNIEQYSFDPSKNGYLEAFARDWAQLDDVRLSEKDENALKTMNTHLHILEAYTSLYRVWKNENLKKQLHNLIIVFLEKIIQSNYHFGLFFDMDWNMSANTLSFGHDIEGSWLLYEAAEVLGDHNLKKRIETIALKMADEVADKGITLQHGVLERCDPKLDSSTATLEWWPQAEGIVGFYNAYQLTGKTNYLDIANNIWNYTKKYFLDKNNGEWFGHVKADGTPVVGEYKVGFWKCPYHNGRACLEIINRATKPERTFST